MSDRMDRLEEDKVTYLLRIAEALEKIEHEIWEANKIDPLIKEMKEADGG